MEAVEQKPKKQKKEKIVRPLKQYTLGEEVFNAVSHGVFALCAVVGGTVVVTLSVLFGGATEIAASIIYAVSLFLLYTMSTLYHAFPFPKVKYIFRIFDHSTVFVLIAGTYTPFMLITLKGNIKGVIICAVVWAVALIGILLNAININRFAKLSLVLYLVMGWSVVFALGDVVNTLPPTGFWLLVLGGLSYTGGVAFYVSKKIKYMHSIWHLFVVLGSALHYFCIVLYVLPQGFTK